MSSLMKKAFGLAAAMLAIGGAQASADVVYGIDDLNRIHAVDMTGKTDTILAPAPGSVSLTGSANGMALDLANNRLLFRSNDSGDLQAFNLASHLITTVVVASAMPGSTADAAFYAGAYWYVQQGTDDLIKIDVATSARTVYADFDGGFASSFGFGDIVITKEGILYGSSNRGFFSLDLANPTAATFNPINASTPQLQLALSYDEKTLYGQQHDGANPGRWYTVDMSTGVATFIPDFPRTTSLRDLAGSTIPEPASVAMMGLGGLAAMAFGRRRLRARA